MVNEQGRSLDIYKRHIMKSLILTIILLTLSTVSYADNIASEPNFCEWLGDTATSVAKNRALGMDEYDLIGKYLSEGKSYGEQSVVIPLIDRVYGIEGDISPDEIAFIEQQRCEIAFVNISK